MVRIGHQLTTTTNNHNESSKEAEERTHRRGVPKLCLPWGIRASTQYSSLGPPDCTSQAASRSVHLFFYGSRSCPTDRQTHRPRYIANNRPHLCTTCMWCGIIITRSHVGVDVCGILSRSVGQANRKTSPSRRHFALAVQMLLKWP